MSVRRLAEIQPESFAFTQANRTLADKWIAKYPEGRQQSAVIPLLMIAQDQEGWVTKPAIEYVAKMLGMPLIRVLEVATFYTQYQLSPVGTRAHVQVCGTTPCVLRGAGELIDVCRSKIHPEQFHTNADGTLSWEEVECLGACVNAPMVMIFKDTYEDLTPERLSEIIDAFEAGDGASVKPGTQIDRITSAPVTGLTTLKDEQAVLKAARRKGTGAAPDVPPSKAAQPAAEKSVPPLKLDKARANQTVDDAGAPGRQRKGRPSTVEEKKAEYKAPELLKGGPIGTDAKKARIVAKSGEGGPAVPALDSPDRPPALERPAKPDDLKLISGVGPKIAQTLNDLGIHTFAQIASWKKAERHWIDAYLSFHGRVERDDRIKQAKALAKGGEAEYIRVFGKKPR
jgi:NADH-quinone oxidoreductase subunit E